MRMLIVALASLAVNVVFWVKYRGPEYLSTPFLHERDVQKDLILFALSAYLALEAVFLLWKNRRPRVIATDDSQGDPNLEQQLEDLLFQREQFQAEIQKAREELAFMTRRVQAVTSERDEILASISGAGEMVGNSSVKNTREGQSVSAVPLSRGMRL